MHHYLFVAVLFALTVVAPAFADDAAVVCLGEQKSGFTSVGFVTEDSSGSRETVIWEAFVDEGFTDAERAGIVAAAAPLSDDYIVSAAEEIIVISTADGIDLRGTFLCSDDTNLHAAVPTFDVVGRCDAIISLSGVAAGFDADGASGAIIVKVGMVVVVVETLGDQTAKQIEDLIIEGLTTMGINARFAHSSRVPDLEVFDKDLIVVHDVTPSGIEVIISDFGIWTHRVGILTEDVDIPFLRGDVDGNGRIMALVDGLKLFQYGFTGGAEPECMAAADSDGNGFVSPLADTLFLLNFQFSAGPPPPAPYPDCDENPDTVDVLGCEEPSCP